MLLFTAPTVYIPQGTNLETGKGLFCFMISEILVYELLALFWGLWHGRMSSWGHMWWRKMLTLWYWKKVGGSNFPYKQYSLNSNILQVGPPHKGFLPVPNSVTE